MPCLQEAWPCSKHSLPYLSLEMSLMFCDCRLLPALLWTVLQLASWSRGSSSVFGSLMGVYLVPVEAEEDTVASMRWGPAALMVST